jgi:hypothetical protein
MGEIESHDLGDGRSEVPLRMITNNIDILLEHSLPCQSISFRRDPNSQTALILVIHGADYAVCEELGFELRSYGE